MRVPPNYPENLQARRTQGRCLVTFDITPEGDTDNVSADCDVSGFERAAERAVREWKYRPEFRDGVAVARTRQRTELVFEVAE